jgi:peptidoglycan/LPS O-acetylase OafA/YrhL
MKSCNMWYFVFVVNVFVSGTVLFLATLLYLIFGNCISPFSTDVLTIRLLIAVFMFVCAGTFAALLRENVRRRQSKLSARKWQWIAAISFTLGLVFSVLVNAALHLLIFMHQFWSLWIALLVAAISVLITANVTYLIINAILNRSKRKHKRVTH